MDRSTKLTAELIGELPNFAEDMTFFDGEFSGLKFIGFAIVEHFYNKKIEYYCGNHNNILTVDDIDKIEKWIPNQNDADICFEKYYRIDFDHYIFIFNHYDFENGRVLMGNLLQKDLETRLSLAEIKQAYLMRLLIHGRQTAYAG